MNRLAAALAALAFVSACGSPKKAGEPAPLDCSGTAGPDCLFNLPSIENAGSLALSLDGPVSIATLDGTPVATVPFKFKGATWHHLTWTHRAVLYLPDPSGTPDWSGTAIYSEYTAPGTDQSNAVVLNEYGKRAAAHSHVPVVVVAGIPPASVTISSADEGLAAIKTSNATVAPCLDTALDENTFDDCATAIAIASGDFTWNGYAAIAAAYLRTRAALLALDPVMRGDAQGATLPPYAPATFAMGGYSKRGIAQWYTAAVEPSVTAVWIGSAEVPDLPALETNAIAQWGDDASGSRAYALSYFATADGIGWLSDNDPRTWASRVTASITEMRGTNDELWPFDEMASYRASYPSIGSVAFVSGAMHVMRFDGNYTIATDEALAGWRGFVSASFGGAAPPAITATYGLASNPITVTANIPGLAAGATVRAWWTGALHCAKPASSFDTFPNWGHDDADLRDLDWSMVVLTGSGGTYSGNLGVDRSALPLHGEIFVDVLEADRFASTVPVVLGSGGTAATCP